jgi:hypothetical protein
MEITMNEISLDELNAVDGGGWLFEALKCAGGIAAGSGIGFELGELFTPAGAVVGAIAGGIIGAVAFC